MKRDITFIVIFCVATTPTACGIETYIRRRSVCPNFFSCNNTYRLRYWNLFQYLLSLFLFVHLVATTPTACGIETSSNKKITSEFFSPLQQHLPLAVLKLTDATHSRVHPLCCNNTYRLRYWNTMSTVLLFQLISALQQHLPLAVLKHSTVTFAMYFGVVRCNNTYRLRYWNCTLTVARIWRRRLRCCNNTYRLRYWNDTTKGYQKDKICCVATTPTACGIETSSGTTKSNPDSSELQQHLPLAVLKLIYQ